MVVHKGNNGQSLKSDLWDIILGLSFAVSEVDGGVEVTQCNAGRNK